MVGVSDLTASSLHASGPDGICATHVPPNLSGTTLSRRTSVFLTTERVFICVCAYVGVFIFAFIPGTNVLSV